MSAKTTQKGQKRQTNGKTTIRERLQKALVFATLIGLVSGILPANKAVKISALEAIRHD